MTPSIKSKNLSQLTALSAAAVMTLSAGAAWAQSSSTTAIKSKKTSKTSSSTSTTPASTAAAPASGTSSASTSSSGLSSITKNMIASYAGVYIGSSVVNPLDSHQPDTTTDASVGSSGVFVDHGVLLGYRLTDRFSLRVAGGARQTAGAGFSVADPSLRANMARLATFGPATLNAEVRYSIPVTQANAYAGHYGTVQLRQAIAMPFGKSRFSATMFLRETTTLRSDYAGQQTLGVYAGPQLEYQVGPTVQLWGILEASASHVAGAGFSGQIDDFEPGLSWDITPTLSFSPFLDIKLATAPSINTTSVNAMLIWSLL